MTEIICKQRGKSPYDGILTHQEIRTARNRFGIEAEQYIKGQILSSKPIQSVMLLCPPYPHNGRKFTYQQGQLLGWRGFSDGTTF